ncbi:MAG: hypothetical protein WCC60_03065 [Ilumatobacteraceae bacterium]
MSNYLLAYRGGSTPEGEAAQQAVMTAWMNWFGELGDAVVDGGAPFGESGCVGGEATAGLTGYSVVRANDIARAQALAAGCPILQSGGTVDVYEAIAM